MKNEGLKELLVGCSKNDRIAQERLFKLYYGKMLYVCLRYHQDRDTAQELVQEGFIKVFEKISSFDFSGSFDAWISRIMANNSIDFLRKNNKNSFVELNDTVEFTIKDNESDIDEIEFDLDVKLALEAVQELSPAYRTVFNLYVIEEFTHKEIAEKLGISEGTSKSNLAKAKQNLKVIIEKKKNKFEKI